MREAGQHFTRVDASGMPAAAFVEYLDTVAALEAAKAYKRRSYELLRLQPGARVIDVGCGAGDDVRAIAELVGGSGRVVGLDISEKLVRQARQRAGDGATVEFAVGDAQALRFDTASFDAARIDRTLQHVADPGRAVDELARVVHSGGRVVACEPDWETLTVSSAEVRVTRAIARTVGDSHTNPWIGRQLLPMLRARGLVELSVDGFIGMAFEFDLADALLGLVPGAAAARETGAISASEEERWVMDLRERSAAGGFFASLSVFVVAGTRP